MSHSLEHASDISALLTEAYRVLGPEEGIVYGSK